MFKVSLAALLASAVLSAKSMNDDAPRFLQAISPPQPPPPPTATPTPDLSSLSFSEGSDGTSKKQHSPKLTCFSCIMNDYLYCQQGADHPHVQINETAPQGVCCESATKCPQLALSGWTCSNSYTDKLLSLRICPFDHSKCGSQSEIVLKNPGESVGQNLTFYPGDLCFFTMRAECGLPAFNPQGLDMVNNVDVYTIEYDDSDVDSIIVSANDTQPTIPDPQSKNNTKMVPKIPLPKKQENFDGKKKNQTQTEAYLLRYQQNADGTTTYFYSNGTYFSYETTETVTFNSPNDTRAYEIRYPSGTNVTVYKDGSKIIKAPGQNPTYVPAPVAPPPAPVPPSAGAYDYESKLNDGTSFGGRRMQALPPPQSPTTPQNYTTTTNTTTMPPPPQQTSANTTTNTTTAPPPPPPTSTSTTNTTSTSANSSTPPRAPAPVPAPSAPVPAPPAPAPPQTPPGTQTLVTFFVPITPVPPSQSSATPEMPSTFNLIPAPPPPAPEFNVYPNFFNFLDIHPPNSTVVPILSDVWGTVVFYLDGRIRELLADGNSTWNLDFYNRAQNPNTSSPNDYNNTAYLRVRVYTNGSYVLNFSNGEVQSNLDKYDWNKFYFNKKPEFTRQILRRQVNTDGSVLIRFLNSSIRYQYPPLNSQMTPYQIKVAILQDDLIPITTSKTINRYYVNGTVARFVNSYFSYYIIQPTSYASDMTQTNFTDGSYVQYFEVSGKEIFYYPPPPQAESTYNKAQAILSIEDNRMGSSRVVYRNGTVAIKNNTNGLIIGYEVPPAAWQPSFEVKLYSACQFEEIDYLQDTRRMFYCLPNMTWTPLQVATNPKVNMTLRDGTRRIFYFNGTISKLANNNSFISFEVPPKSYFYEFTTVQNADGSSYTNFTYVNGTIRFIAARMTPNNTPFQVATAVNYRDVYKNGTERVFYLNKTVAIFNSSYNGTVLLSQTFVRFEVPPAFLYDGCLRLSTTDGSRVFDCGSVNSTIMKFFPPLNYANTAFENATAPFREIFNQSSGTTNRFYVNGTAARFNQNDVFEIWLVAPFNNTLAPVPANTVVNVTSSGIKQIFVNNTLIASYYPHNDINSSQIENFTGMLYQEFTPLLGLSRIQYRNGSSGIRYNNGTFIWTKPPTSFYVPFYNSFNFSDNSNITTWDDGVEITDYPPTPESATDYQKAVALKRRVRFAQNTTEIKYYFNQTVAEFRNGSFFRYIVPPKNILITGNSNFGPDGSQQITYSNGTYVYIGPPPVQNETLEQFAYRIVRSEFFNNTRIDQYANGTVAVFQFGELIRYQVAPQQWYVSRQVDNQADGSIKETFSNGTIRTTFAPPSPQLDELAKSRYMTFEDLNTVTREATRRYFNGTVGVFNATSNKLLRYIVAPQKLYTGCVPTTETTSMTGISNGQQVFRCWNNTLRVIPVPLPSTATDYQRAIEVQLTEWLEGSPNATVFYKNGTIAVLNQTNQAVLSYIQRPQYIFQPYTVTNDLNGDQRTTFGNGTIFIRRANVSANATLFEKATAQLWFRDYSNGTTETRFVNGTHIKSVRNTSSGIDQITYIVRVEGNINVQVNNTIAIAFANSTQRIFYTPLPSTATDYERAISPEYKDLFLNGSSVVKFLNGSVAFMNSTGGFVRYIIPPQYFFSDIVRTNFSDGSFQLQYLKNMTVRYFVAPLPTNATKKDRALALLYIEKFLNGTMKRAFVNGTIAVYQNNILVKYDVKPKSFFNEDQLDTSVEDQKDDGSRVQYFNNNTVRYFDSPLNKTDRLYRDCFPNSTCIVFFKNGSRSRFDGERFVWNQGPPQAPAQEAKDPNYNYVNKTGPKIQAYDRSQGGIKKYKEDYQNNDNRGSKAEPKEPICKGRNQMIIMGDLRIKRDVYSNSSRILQTGYDDEEPSSLALQVQSVSFIPDVISSGSFLKLTLAAALMAFNVIMF